MAFDPLSVLSAVNAGTSVFNTLFGDDDEAQLKKSIKALLKRGQEGIDRNVFQNLVRNTKERVGQETSASRSAAINRLLRQGTPIQVQEQIVGDIGTRGGRRLDEAITGLNAENEQIKLQALRSAGGLAQGLQRFNPAAGLQESLVGLLQGGNPFEGLFGGDDLEQVKRKFGGDLRFNSEFGLNSFKG